MDSAAVLALCLLALVLAVSAQDVANATLTNGTAPVEPPADDDDESAASAGEVIIFYLTYILAMASGIFGIKKAREMGYCKEASMKEKAGEKLDFAKKGFLS